MHGIEQRFWIMTDTSAGRNRCWPWKGSLNEKGYAKINLGRGYDGKYIYARVNRVAHELFIGPIPDKHDVDHKCHNRRCVNPRHLEAVLHSVNLGRRRPFKRNK